MSRTEIFNSIAKWGLILGVVMTISKIIEIEMFLKGTVSMSLLIVVEMIISMLVYFYICYRANIERKMSLDQSSNYGFRDVLNWSMVVSLFAGIIAGIATHVYINTSLGGYGEYMNTLHEAMVAIVDSAQLDAESRKEAMGALESYTAIEGVDQISIFEAVISTTMNYIIGGFLTGLVITRFVGRYKKEDNASE